MLNPAILARNLLYILQVEEYHLGRFWRWLAAHRDWVNLEQKKNLVWTFKVKILFALTLLIWAFLVALSLVGFWNIFHSAAIVVVFAVIVLGATKPLIALSLLTASVVLAPFVLIAARFYIVKAAKKRKFLKHLKVIGISGSFGKTSIKEFLSGIAERQCKVLKSPENINTLLGLTRLILQKLDNSHQIFIAEIGAYRRGDTRAVANLIQPHIGILVGLNAQHFERFGNFENIIATESELFETLREGGLAVLNRDDPYFSEVKKRVGNGIRLISFSLNEKVAGEFRIEYLTVDENGSRFDLSENDTKYRFETKLLGKHNIANLLAAILAAHYGLGMRMQDIAAIIPNIEPPAHRLQLIKKDGDIIVLDDSYNINPDGAKAALEVLSLFKERRKIVLTHGLVELGELQEKLNQEFGEQLGKTADIVIVAGPNAVLIEKGLKNAEFPADRLIQAQDINEAAQKLRTISRAGDIILIQTDLPDSYY